ncbi:MAG: hypothetical protein L7R49_03710 [Nitrosopumilus sp.]|jgi:hypothetical protein|nr:hypothetical protein [Nitrosopumilus sp.]|tara:strand:- start:606 stop:800 length:195 start_codon:yes stop_codon:yes gene_type:complete
MRFIFIVPVIALVSIVIGTIGVEYYNNYAEERELENLIVSCMKQFGHYSEKLVDCLDDNSLSNP